jgi:GH24 family phage-related lysozyme (muramidase)
VGISLGEGILLSSRQIEIVHGHGDAADACSAVERWWEGGKCERQADRRSIDALLVILFISDLRVGTGHTG